MNEMNDVTIITIDDKIDQNEKLSFYTNTHNEQH